MMLSKKKPPQPPKKRTFEIGFGLNLFKKRFIFHFFFDIDKP